MNDEKALNTRIHKVSEITEADVSDSQGRDVGKISDIIVTQSGGWTPYIILDYKDNLYTIPWRAIVLQTESAGKIEVSLNVDTESIEKSESFDLANWPDMSKPQWGARVCDYFGCEPVWVGHEPQEIKVQSYDLSKAQTVTGKVVKIYNFTPTPDAPEIAALDVKTEDDEVYSVHLAPVWFFEYQRKEIREGDTVSVKGVKTLVGNEPAIIAAEIDHGSDIIVLRDKRGMPSWKAWTIRENLEVHRTSSLFETDIRSLDGKKIGSIVDLAIDVDKGQIPYVVLSTYGLDHKRIVVPWKFMKLSFTEDKFLIHLNKDQMKSAPGFEDKWPDMTDEDWIKKVNEFYQTNV
ncbi:hypothetical protein GF312_04715 [Candidatus Poribacteria bacterium]|nr:hypothetical protein [Candidatus Poribacteria bacterium]